MGALSPIIELIHFFFKVFFIFICVQAQQIHSMFPNVPIQAITLDLADTHSVSLTVDRILSDSIYIPEGGVADVPPGEDPAPSSSPPLPSGSTAASGAGGEGNEDTSTASRSTTPRHSHDPLPPGPTHMAPATPLALSVSAEETRDGDVLQRRGSHLANEARASLDDRPTGDPSGSRDLEESSDAYEPLGYRRSDKLETSCGTRASHDAHGDEPRGSHDPHTDVSHADEPPQASERESGVLDTTQGPETELRQRRTDGSDARPEESAIRMARVIGSGSSSGREPDSLSSRNEFPSTSETYSQLFSSLQERKAELLRRARRYVDSGHIGE